jgi:disulfide bond formation protein DsbB
MVLLGGFYVEFVLGRRPCTLCLLTRVCMMGICASLLMNLLLGFSARQTALASMFALLGIGVSLKQLAFHVCGSKSPPPSAQMLGFDLWTWAFFVFMCTLIGLSLLLFITNKADHIKHKRGWFSVLCSVLLFLIVVVNLVVATDFCHFGSDCEYKSIFKKV